MASNEKGNIEDGGGVGTPPPQNERVFIFPPPPSHRWRDEGWDGKAVEDRLLWKTRRGRVVQKWDSEEVQVAAGAER